jgi:hypothetical protein
MYTLASSLDDGRDETPTCRKLTRQTPTPVSWTPSEVVSAVIEAQQGELNTLIDRVESLERAFPKTFATRRLTSPNCSRNHFFLTGVIDRAHVSTLRRSTCARRFGRGAQALSSTSRRRMVYKERQSAVLGFSTSIRSVIPGGGGLTRAGCCPSSLGVAEFPEFLIESCVYRCNQ